MLCCEASLHVMRDKYLGWIVVSGIHPPTQNHTPLFCVLLPFKIRHYWVDTIGKDIRKARVLDAIQFSRLHIKCFQDLEGIFIFNILISKNLCNCCIILGTCEQCVCL